MRKYLLIFTLLVVSVGYSKSSKHVDTTYQHAFSFFFYGEYDTAIKVLEKKINQATKVEPRLYELLLKCHLKNHNYYHVINYGQNILKNGYIIKRSEYTQISILISVARAYTVIRNLEMARSTVQTTEKLFYKYENRELRALLYYIIADIERSIDEQKAIYYYDLAIANSIPTDETLIDLYISYADLWLEKPEFSKAAYYLEKAYELCNTTFRKNKIKLANYHIEKGYYYYKNEETQKSLDYYNNYLKPIAFSRSNRSYDYLKCDYYRFSSWFYTTLGHFDNALDHCSRSETLLENYFKENHFRYGEIYYAMSRIYSRMRKKSIALEWSKKAIPIYRNLGEPTGLVNALNFEMRLAYNSENYPQVIKIANEILALGFSHKDFFYDQLDAHYYKALCFYRKKKFQDAKVETASALKKIASAYGNKKVRWVKYYRFYLNILIHLKENNDIEKVYQEIISLLGTPAGNNLPSASILYQYYSWHLFTKGDIDLSYKYLQKAVKCNLFKPQGSDGLFPDINNVINKGYMAITYERIGLVHFQKYNLTKDINELRKGLSSFLFSTQLINTMRMRYRPQTDRLRENYDFISPFESVLITCYLLYQETDNISYLKKSFEFAEQNKASILLGRMNATASVEYANISDSVQLKEKQLKTQIAQLQSSLYSKEQIMNDTALTQIQNQLTDKKLKYDEFVQLLEKDYPAYHGLKYDYSVIPVTSLQEQLKADEAIVEYHSAILNNYAYVVTKDTLAVYQLPKLTNDNVSQIQKSLRPNYFINNKKEAYDKFVEASTSLYDTHFAPLESELERIHKLYIIPHGPSSYLPFELLIREKPSKKLPDYRKLDYLVKHYDISYAYSATTLFKNRNIDNSAHFNDRVLAFAPSYKSLLADSSKMAALGKFRDVMVPLEWNGEEVTHVSQHFDTKALNGAMASEKEFKENLNQYGILHFAMHALVDEDDPMRSRLVFTQTQDSIDDNYLHNFELYNMDIKAQLAVLSACNTGYGKEMKSGEGLMSLARAFIYAGCPAVVMSHWRVDDKATSIIMDSFYKYLAEGRTKDNALRLAKLDYLQNGSPSTMHPFYWNNFVVLGDTSPVTPPSRKVYWLSMAFILLFMIGVTKMNLRQS